MNKHYNKTSFQGSKKSNEKKYFEGWYFKNTNENSDFTISFIPGISYNKVDPHCFIQCIICDENKKLSNHYFRYDLSKFSYKTSPFQVQINGTIFSDKFIQVNLNDSEISIEGSLEFNNLEPLNSTMVNPNIMGFFSYIPKMECNHHIISMHHTISGSVTINDKKVDLTNGIGYMEKDWGKSFPSEYIWIQCNHFDDIKTRLALSTAKIPFLGLSFRGFFCSVFIDNKEYRFATYNRSKIKVDFAKDGRTSMKLTRGHLELIIVASVDNVQSLASPKNGVMNDSIKEGLAGSVDISFKNKKTNEEYCVKGNNAGIEIMMSV